MSAERQPGSPLRIAVVGGGVSGLLAARLLGARHEVTLFEAQSYVGGHTHTVDIEADRRVHPLDTGFMVFNRRTYPLFGRLLELLRIESRPSDMSFSVRCDATGLEYQGSSCNGLFAQRRNLVRPQFYRMLLDVLRFNRLAQRQARCFAETGRSTSEPLGEFLRRHAFSDAFRRWYLLPMASAIWSSRWQDVQAMPAWYLMRFFHNHGLVQLRDRPQWRTIPGGARRYVQALLADQLVEVRTSCPVRRVQRDNDRAYLETPGGETHGFDRVVLGVHADQALRLLADASPDEQRVLGAFRYQDNAALVHTDAAVMSRSPRGWASWNYRVPAEPGRAATVTYWLNRLQGHRSRLPLLETLNPTDAIDQRHVLKHMAFRHPILDVAACQAQDELPTIQGQRQTYFCGAYWGNGFHEDGVRSAVHVAEHFDLDWEQCIAVSTKDMCGTSGISR